MATHLSTGQINLVIGPSRPHATDLQLEVETFTADTLGIVCRKDHPLTQMSEILPQDNAMDFLPLGSTALLRPIGIVQRGSHNRSNLEIAFLRHLMKAVMRGDGKG